MAQLVNNPPANSGDTEGWEDPLEKEVGIHSSILVWRIPWTEEPSGLHSMGSQRVGSQTSALVWTPNLPLVQLDTWAFPAEKTNFSHIAGILILSRHSILSAHGLSEWNQCCCQDPRFQSIFIHTASYLLGEGIVIQLKLRFWQAFILLVYHYNPNWTRRPWGVFCCSQSISMADTNFS